MRIAYKVSLGGAVVGALGGIMYAIARDAEEACKKRSAPTDLPGALVPDFNCALGPGLDADFAKVPALAGAIVAVGGLTVGLIQGK